MCFRGLWLSGIQTDAEDSASLIAWISLEEIPAGKVKEKQLP